MSKLKELLEGIEVEWKSLGDVIKLEKGKQLNKEFLFEDGQYPAFNGGTSFSGFTDFHNYNENTIIISQGGASAGFVNFITTKFYANAHCYVVLPNIKKVENRFIYHFLKLNQARLMTKQHGAGIPALRTIEILEIQIPIPCPENPKKSLEIQKEIVRILDTFTELEAELAAELQKRRMQYKYYSTLLFDNVSKSDLHSIEEVCQVKKGATPIQKATPGEYPMVVTTSERKSCETYQFDAKAVCIPLVSSRGHGVASLNQVYYQEGKFALGNILCAIIPKNENKVCSKYLYYYFQRTKDYTLVPLMKGGANVALRTNDIEKIKVPIPSLEEQKRIVRILDKFDTLTTSMSEGLPKEIALRKKQYEYYRDRLLTFK